MGREEDEYNRNPAKRLENITIYEDKRITELTDSLKRVEQKVNLLIRMLTAHDYDSKKIKR